MISPALRFEMSRILDTCAIDRYAVSFKCCFIPFAQSIRDFCGCFFYFSKSCTSTPNTCARVITVLSVGITAPVSMRAIVTLCNPVLSAKPCCESPSASLAFLIFVPVLLTPFLFKGNHHATDVSTSATKLQ